MQHRLQIDAKPKVEHEKCKCMLQPVLIVYLDTQRKGEELPEIKSRTAKKSPSLFLKKEIGQKWDKSTLDISRERTSVLTHLLTTKYDEY